MGLSRTVETFKSFVTPQLKWRLCSLENGLRFFEEDPHITFERRANIDVVLLSELSPALKGVGFIFSRPELVFRLAMDLGNSRPEWDLTFDYGSVIEQIDEQTDIIHVAFKQKCSPRDFCLKRCWGREPDGSYIIVFSSVDHPEVESPACHISSSLDPKLV
mmetsp:Transcript_5818/g.14784  ORF Transcript_5818/g.14784 Transcript_5818/m.14784 type:complete len:161 (-) Transcript_5818:3694-4176(-)